MDNAIKITASSGLDKDEVDRLVKDAQAHSEEDKKRREIVEVKNQADSLIYGTEKNLTEHGDKIPADDKAKITDAIAAMKTAMEGDDLEAMKSAMEALTTASHKLAEEMYKQTAAEAATSGAENDGAGTEAANDAEAKPAQDESVVDAEFEEVEKEKK